LNTCRGAAELSCWDGFSPPGRHEDGDGDDWVDSDDLEDDHAPWRGDQHLDDWPENLAGPEYWLYRSEVDEPPEEEEE